MQSMSYVPYTRDLQLNKDPPPYPGHLRQPRYRQSYSGSEASTDISLSSTENLCTFTRQDPQGEETACVVTTPVKAQPDPPDSSYSILSRLAQCLPAAEVRSADSRGFYVTGSMKPNSPSQVPAENYVNLNLTQEMLQKYQQQQQLKNNIEHLTSQRMLQMLKAGDFSQNALQQIAPPDQQLVRYPISSRSPTPSAQHSPQQAPSALPPPPQYPQAQPQIQYTMSEKKELRRSYEMLEKKTITRSQPDLTQLLQAALTAAATTHVTTLSPAPNMAMTQALPKNTDSPPRPNSLPAMCSPKLSRPEPRIDPASLASRSTQLISRLSEENKSLKEEITVYVKKVSKLKKFELELKKVYDAHKEVVKHTNKRENLEKAMRQKLEDEIKRIKCENASLQEQVTGLPPSSKEVHIEETQPTVQLNNRDQLLKDLLERNKELTGYKDRYEIEIAAQRSTLKEQRAHIDVLDNALANAQTTIAHFQNELRKYQDENSKINHLQGALSALQATNEKRELLEQKLRSKLEEEVQHMRTRQYQQGSTFKLIDHDEGIASDTEAPTSVQALYQQLREKEQRIIQLESEVIKWEQKYLEECAMHQFAMDMETMPKDARIAALEQCSIEAERLMADAKTEKMKQMEAVYDANRKAADFETKWKTSQAQLAEKDAMIRVLQKQNSMSRTSSVSSLLGSPVHSRKASNTSQQSSLSSSRLDLLPYHMSHNKTGSVTSSSSSLNLSTEDKLRELQKKLLTQVSLLSDEGNDEVSTHLWQV